MARHRNDNAPNLPAAAEIIELLSRADYRPQTPVELMQTFKLPAASEPAFQRLMARLIRQGTVVQLRKKGYALARSADLVVGKISFTRSGSAFVNGVDGKTDVFVPSSDTGTALHGDKVLVRLDRSDRKRRPSDSETGKIVRVLERQTHTMVGTVKQARSLLYVEPMHSWFPHDVAVPNSGGAELGDRVLVRLAEWDDPRLVPEGEVIEVIGPEDDPALDTLAVIRSFALPQSFPPEAMQEAETARLDPDEAARRLDLRNKYVFTIDPETARDFDDAISLERQRNGRWRLGIHIADVSHFVAPRSALDDEARERATSVYLPDKVIPMLPEQLSNGLCSLSENVDRLAFSVFVTLDDQANFHGATFAETIICSRRRLTYEQAMTALRVPTGESCPEARLDRRGVERLKQVHALAMQLRQRRLRAGSLEMSMPEVRFQIGEDGRIGDIEQVVNDESHQLIEECMLLANEAVCRELSQAGWQLLHRIHDVPDPEKLAELTEMLLLAGVEARDLTDRENLCELLREIAGAPDAHVWNMMVLRSMRKAIYSPKNVGHYGLAKEFYTHFTSPIRRYPDLVVHRILKAYLAKAENAYDFEQLRELGDHCSEREQRAAEAEREIVDLKRLRFFAEQLESEAPREYQAIITQVRNFGIFIYLPEVQANGMVHVSQLSDDFFDFNPVRLELRGRRSNTVFAVGVQLTVIIAKVDTVKRFLDFQPVTVTATSARAPLGRKRRAAAGSPQRDGRPERGGGGEQSKRGDKRGRGRRRK